MIEFEAGPGFAPGAWLVRIWIQQLELTREYLWKNGLDHAWGWVQNNAWRGKLKLASCDIDDDGVALLVWAEMPAT